MPPRNLQPSALALVVVPAVLSTLLVGVRVWRRHITKKFAIEDVLLVIAQVLIIVLTYTTWQCKSPSFQLYPPPCPILTF